MSKDKNLNVAKGLASQLGVAEEAIDTAMAEAAQLIDACVTARRAIRLSPTQGQDVYRHTLEAMQALHVAQREMAAAHEGLRQMQSHIGLGTVSVIPLGDKPDREKEDTTGFATEDLRIEAPKDYLKD